MDLGNKPNYAVEDMDDDSSFDLSEAKKAFKRRRGKFVMVFLVILVIGITTAMLIPSKYQSSATMLISHQSIPKHIIMPTITGYAEQRIAEIKQRILNATTLFKLVRKYNLYADYRKSETTEEIIDRMKSDINLEMISASVIDPRSGRPTKANIAFRISFVAKSPSNAQKVATDLMNKFREINLKTRKGKAAEATLFLKSRVDHYAKQVAKYEKELAEFKRKNAGQLPGLAAVNTQMLNRAEVELKSIQSEINALKQNRIFFTSQLSQTDPYASSVGSGGQKILGDRERLKVLKSRLISLRATYEETHPDVIKLKKEIKALERSVGSTTSVGELRAQLRAKRSELRRLSKRYSKSHPDVKKLNRDIVSLKKEIRSARRNKGAKRKVAAPDNPVYINLQTKIKSIDSQIELKEKTKEQLREKIKSYEVKLLNTPRVEQELREILRGYKNALQKYDELKAKYEAARDAENLEGGQQAERFDVIDRPLYPEKPISPNRPMIVLLAIAAAFAAGFGTVVLLEAMDSSVRGYKGVRKIMGAPPLASIPLISEVDLAQPKSSNWWKIIIGIGVAIGVGLLLIHVFYQDLDVLWFRGLRKLGLG